MSSRIIGVKVLLVAICLNLLIHGPEFLYAQAFNGLDKRTRIYEVIDWRMSETDIPVELPVFLSESIHRTEIYHIFQISDSLQDSQLRIWLTNFDGDIAISINGHTISPSGTSTSPAYFDIPQTFIKFEHQNKLSVGITHTPEGRTTPVHQFRESVLPGIFGEICFEWIPSVHFRDFRYEYTENNLVYRYMIDIKLDDSLASRSTGKLRYVEELYTPDGRSIFNRYEYIDFRNGSKAVERKIPLSGPLTWSPDTPDLYLVRLKIFSATGLIDQVEYSIGLRKLSIKNGHFTINGKSLVTRGITYRDRSLRTGWYARMCEDLVFIKMSGFNAIRFPHRVPHPYLFQLADSLGLLLFPELNTWRQTESFFSDDDNLAGYKLNLIQGADILVQHPSMAAIGLGHELPIDAVAVQKFILIANEYLKQKYNLTTYLSPLDARNFPATRLTDFYMVNKYDAAIFKPLSSFVHAQILRDGPILIGNAGLAISDSTVYDKHLSELLSHLNAQAELDGYFIESFQDWVGISGTPATFDMGRADLIYPYGLFTFDHKARISPEILHQYIFQQDNPVHRPVSQTKSNVFTITTFIAAILFFLLYRNNFRLRDNLKRSLLHAHGFFVDLRDRRIIALLNSAIVGLFTNLQVSVIITAFFFYFRQDLLIAEVLSTILTPLNLYADFYELSGTPLLLLIIIWVLFYFGQVAIAIFLKMFNLFSHENIRFRQSIAICHWAGAPLIFLLPISLFSLQIIEMDIFQLPLLGLMLICFFWFNFRLANGIRVLMVIKAYKVFSVLILTYCLVVFIFFAFLDTRSDLYEYLILLTRAGNLF